MQRISAPLLLLAFLAVPLHAQEDSLPSGTWARRGMIVGALTVGAAGSLMVGALSAAYCEYECDGAFVGGLVVGGLGGVALGGLAGLVVGAAIPRGGGETAAGERPDSMGGEVEAEPVRAPPWRGPWELRIGVGPARPVQSEDEETDLRISLAALRPTSARVRWGLELGYMGTRRQRKVFTIPITTQDTAVITSRWERQLWNASLVAMRTLEGGDHASGYLLASAGVHPFRESVESTRTGDPPTHPVPPPVAEEATSPLPGVGLGGGIQWRLSRRIRLGVDSRFHLILGAPDELGPGVASLGGTVWLGG